MEQENIYLTGSMGVGKTTLGKILAEKLQRPFLDLDQEIEKKSGMKISKIFELYGEPYFRKLEVEALEKTLSFSSHVISLGGGAVLDSRNQAFLKAQKFWINLSADFEVLRARLEGGSEDRPLFKKLSSSELEKMEEKRRPFYEAAPFQIDTSRLQPQEIVRELIEKVF